jgi:hypothetical protein
MALMLAKLYTALREAGTDDDKAREAAEEVASFENRLANVEASLMVLKWMVGCNLILTVAIVGMLFFVLASEFTADGGTTAGTSAGSAGALFRPASYPPPWDGFPAGMPRQGRRKAAGDEVAAHTLPPRDCADARLSTGGRIVRTAKRAASIHGPWRSRS